jgi:ElaA protein
LKGVVDMVEMVGTTMNSAASIDWHWSAFDHLSPHTLYALLNLRQRVFVIEQGCLYPDIDGFDLHAMHLLGWQAGAGQRTLVAYLRVLPPGLKYSECAIGRILTIETLRGQGVGAQLVGQALQYAQLHFPDDVIRISAQLHLQRFYERFGFEVTSAPYDEGGIMHIDMLRPVDTLAASSLD